MLLTLGLPLLGLGRDSVAGQWLAAARGPWALPLAVAAFAALAFLGAPQFALIAAAVLAFGPWRGAAYSWIGTLVSALVGFWLGRVSGAAALRRFGGAGVDRFLDLVARNGFWASLLVRLAPFAPFVVVNMAAGVTAMGVVDFVAGTALGIIPKIAVTALAGGSLSKATRGGGWIWIAALAAAVAVWAAIGWLTRRWLRRPPGSA